jgi:hypothetical protein
MLDSYDNKATGLNNNKKKKETTISCTFSVVSVNCVVDSRGWTSLTSAVALKILTTHKLKSIVD